MTTGRRERPAGCASWAALAVACAGCAAEPEREPEAVVDEALVARAGHGLRAVDEKGALPAGVDLGDGLDADEAVALSLWNDPSFRAELATLAIARADLAQAGLLPNPVFSFLFPVGPKQWEAALRWPLDELFTRGTRIELAQLELAAAAQRLVASGLARVRDVKVAFAEAKAAEETERLHEQVAARRAELVALAEARLRIGVASERSLSDAREAATAAAGEHHHARGAAIAARARLAASLGVEIEQPRVALLAAGTDEPLAAATAAEEAQWRADALDARPEARAAELAVEAAAQREAAARWAIVSVGATIDVNGNGDSGAEIGPGVDLAVPLLDQGDERVARAGAELAAARLRADAVAARIGQEVARASLERTLAQERLAQEIAPRLEIAQANAARARATSAAGAASRQQVIEAELVALARQLDAVRAHAELRRAQAELEAAVGRRLEVQPS